MRLMGYSMVCRLARPCVLNLATALVWSKVGALTCLVVLGCAVDTREPIETRLARTEPPAGGGAAGEASTGEPEPTSSWCAVREVLEAKCQRCHGEEPQNGAPFSLTSYDDTQALNKRGKPRFEAIASALSSQLMPPTYLELEPPVAALEDGELALVLDWCERGAPGDAADDCAPSP
jgi:uncharacterized membrane protein